MFGFSHEAQTFLLHPTILGKLPLGVAQAPHRWAALETQLPLGFDQARLSPSETDSDLMCLLLKTPDRNKT